MSDSLVELLTALGDDELVIGHRHSEWTGYAPHLEEDIAFSSIAQDEIGHATAYYSLLGKVTGDEPDALALGRAKDAYRNAIICERPNGDWAYTLARHWLYDTADDIRLAALKESSHADVAALVTKIRREERYHLIHANSWMRRVAKGPVEGRTRLMDAIGVAFPEAVALFEPIEQEDAAVKEGWLPTPSDEMRRRFLDGTEVALDELGLPTEIHAHAAERAEFVASSSGDLIDAPGERESDAPPSDGGGGRRGRHTADFESLWDDMTTQYRAHPGASW